jgi:hypothetical protein
MHQRHHSRFLLSLALAWALLALSALSAQEAKPAAPAVRLLVVSTATNGMPTIDEAYRQYLTARGFSVTVVTHEELLSADYLRQYPVVVLANLPYAGQEHDVFGYQLRNVPTNLALLQAYVAEGGGLVLMPTMPEFGEAYGQTYDNFLAPFGARYLIQQLRDEDSAGKTPYATGTVLKTHPITKEMAQDKLLYPVRVMRWDNAYSTTPLLLEREWSVLAQGNPAAGTAIALNNSDVGPRQTSHRALFAVRTHKNGMLAASAIGAYYTLTAVSSKNTNIGENDTGVIDFAVIKGEAGGRPSAFGDLLERTFTALAQNSLKQGVGIDKGLALPAQPPYPESTAVIDWSTQQLPPTWAHRVIVGGKWPNKTYDELPDPLVQGEMNYWKVLIGPRSRYSSGSGSVRAYREAALKAGYSAIVFAETFPDLTEKSWRCLVQDCVDNTDETFVCLPGLEIDGTSGGRYLVLCANRYPDPAWLTPDGKKLDAVRMLSLGWQGQLSVVHRPNSQRLSPQLFKQYQGITVATYDTRGQLVDDGMFAYQWSVASDSNPIPLAVHEVTSPADVARAATAGFQQIMPAPKLSQAVDYFHYGMVHFFSCPVRYFLSEGPILDGWSIYNKDKGKAAENREHYRLGVGVRAGTDDPIAEVKLLDGFQTVRRWLPGVKEFRATVDGFHDAQHLYTLMAKDAKGRRVLSPGIRTVTRNWRLRCGDRQNWLGHFWIYTGFNLNGMPGYSLKLAGTPEGQLGWNGNLASNACPIFDYRFFSDHVQMADADFGSKYIDATYADIAADGAKGAPVRPTDVVDGRIRSTYFNVLKRKDFAVLDYQVDLRLKQDAVLEGTDPINPVLGGVFKGANNNLLILPGKEPEPLFPVDAKTGRKDLKGARAPFELPVGSYVAGIIPLTPGLTLNGDRFGSRVAPGDLGNVPEGTQWSARYLILDSTPFVWKHARDWNDTAVDDKAVQALTEMGFRGKTPYALELTQGKLERTAYHAFLTAQNGGVSGRCVNESKREMLFHVPFLISGVNPRIALVLWRADTGALEHFAAYQGVGYVPFNADKTVEFYAGHAAVCDPRLAVEIVDWTPGRASFRVHNPTSREITTDFVTPAAIKGYKAVKTTLTIKAGASVEVTE